MAPEKAQQSQAKAKAATKAKGNAHSSTAASAPVVRRPSRQDERVKAQRIVNTKLKMYNPEVVLGIIGKSTGLSVIDYLVEYGIRLRKGNLASKFWVQFHAEFSLTLELFKNMPKASADLDVAEVLLDALGPAQDDNPAHRTSGPFLDYILHVPAALNLTELTVCVKNSLPSQKVSETTSMKMVASICKHIGRFGIYAKEPEWWGQVSGDFDKKTWHACGASKPTNHLRPATLFS